MKLEKQHLSFNPYSRPGEKLDGVKALIIHWVANAGTSAQANRNFFESRRAGKLGYGSAHYIVGLDGEVIECLPTSEVAYHVGSESYTRFTRYCLTPGNPNFCTIGIELCHPGADGVFSDLTLNAAGELCSKLCQDFGLNPYKAISTHKAVVGWKDCPKSWVEDPGELQRFQKLVSKRRG